MTNVVPFNWKVSVGRRQNMKAEITEIGELVITPENGTESFALQRWNAGFSQETTVEQRPTLICRKIDSAMIQSERLTFIGLPC
jgi:hypothetical protein